MSKGIYDAMDIANYTVNYCIDENMPVSNLKLQKLLYYIQAASLVEENYNKKMFADNISAWKYGPVVESVYHNFKWYVDKEITEKVTEKDLFFEFDQDDQYDPSKVISKEDKDLICKVIDSYKDYSALKMVNKTHEEDPWKSAFFSNEDYIEVESIKRFYSEKNNRALIYG